MFNHIFTLAQELNCAKFTVNQTHTFVKWTGLVYVSIPVQPGCCGNGMPLHSLLIDCSSLLKFYFPFPACLLTHDYIPRHELYGTDPDFLGLWMPVKHCASTKVIYGQVLPLSRTTLSFLPQYMSMKQSQRKFDKQKLNWCLVCPQWGHTHQVSLYII